MVSGSISLLCSRCFSPFPHGTGSLSVSREYLALRDGPRCFSQDFSCPAILRMTQLLSDRFVYGDFTLSVGPFQILLLHSFKFLSCSYNPGFAETMPVWAAPRSLATTCGITLVFFSYGYLDVSVPHVRLSFEMPDLQPGGLPHSDIPESMAICASSGLFAAYHVLPRLREPRHPPSALSYFSLALDYNIIPPYRIPSLSLRYPNGGDFL